mgnify:CR=1 FL=1|tara:strand:+ start:59 stop:256 length:198 start_codon:yes stop_codon:yes gene_type:complete
MPIMKKKKLVYIDARWGKREQKEKWFETSGSHETLEEDIEQFRASIGAEIVSITYNQTDDYFIEE